ncbi:MAG: hypothetical protein EOM55_03370, partial [Clostridia bacterium]|nr:hypothetical protein [Clostridia bacterium]
LAQQVKNVFNLKGVAVVCIDNIDNVLLNRYSNIEFLILDFTRLVLDEKSLSLIQTLRYDGVIEKVIAVFSKDTAFTNNFYSVIYNEDFEISFKNFFEKYMESRATSFDVSFCSWRKVISNYLCDCGFSTKNAGFLMIVDTLIYFIDRNCAVRNFSKELYVYLAHKFCSTVAGVEITVRKTIRNAFINKKENFPFDHCPTIKEFFNYTISQLYDEVISTKVLS